jgi:hypothetical protein
MENKQQQGQYGDSGYARMTMWGALRQNDDSWDSASLGEPWRYLWRCARRRGVGGTCIMREYDSNMMSWTLRLWCAYVRNCGIHIDG